jgi:hypothetical protein
MGQTVGFAAGSWIVRQAPRRLRAKTIFGLLSHVLLIVNAFCLEGRCQSFVEEG